LILLSVLAKPVVRLLLGPQWHAAAPLVQIFAIALLFNFPTALNYPIQVAVGAIRHTVSLAFVQTTVSLVVLTLAAQHGLRAVALSTFITIPFNVALSVLVVRSQVPFAWRELAACLSRSAVVAAFSMAGPLLTLVLLAPNPGRPVVQIVLAVGLGGLGWLGGLWLTRHRLFGELRQACGVARGLAVAALGGPS
jgi:O-antigen/teichoic acid export membrane protein